MKNATYKTNCCTHYNGTNEYILGYIIFPFINVVMCKDCGEVQSISKGISAGIEKLLLPFWNGKVYLSDVTIKQLKEEEVE